MSYQPIVPLSGYAGWKLLNNTLEVQKEAFDNDPIVDRELQYFKDNIGSITSAEELVGDYQLLKVALGAFGLDADIGNKYFIQKILDEGTIDENSLANNLTESAYFNLSEAFGFDQDPPNTIGEANFFDKISEAYTNKQFQAAVGESNENFRLGLNLTDELAELTSEDTTENGMWYSIMGNEPLLQVFRTAFGLPESFSALDVDDQLDRFKAKADALYGDDSVTQFTDPETQETLLRNFFVRSQINDLGASNSPAQNALALLQRL